MTNEMVPTLAPHVNVLATITGATLDFFNFVIGGCLSLFALCASPSRGHRYHWMFTTARGALWRRGLCSGWSGDPPFFSRWGSRSFVFLLHNTARGRCPRSLFIPRRGACSGPCWSWVLLNSLSSDHHRGVPLGSPLGGLRCGVFNDNRRLCRLLASDVVGTSDAALTKIWHFTNVKSCSNKRKNNNNDRRKCQDEIVLLIDRSAYASL